jgi:hypothetical protein
MKSYLPEKVSNRTLTVVRQMNSAFLDSITESDADHERRQKCYEDWLKSTGKKTSKGNGEN